jgi:hypothetical protein
MIIDRSKIKAVVEKTITEHVFKNITPTFRYSHTQRKIELKTKPYQQLRENYKKKTSIDDSGVKKTVKNVEEELCNYDHKSCFYENIKAYMKAKNKANNLLQTHYEDNLYRKLKWYSFINKQKSESKMINNFKKAFNITKPENTLIAIGDFSRNKTLKNHEPAKGKSMRNLLKRNGFNMYLINEYNTSAKSFIDGAKTEKFRPRINKKGNVVLCHGLLRSKNAETNQGKEHILVNRDFNGSMNILTIAQCILERKELPPYLLKPKKCPLHR